MAKRKLLQCFLVNSEAFQLDNIFDMSLHCDLLDAENETDRRFHIASSQEVHGSANSLMKSEKSLEKIAWACNIFNEWAKLRKTPMLSELSSIADINEHFPKFILEARKKNKDPYAPNSLYEIIICLQQAINRNLNCDYKMLNEKDFKPKPITLLSKR